MRLFRLSSAVLSFLEPLSEKRVLSVSYVGGTLYKQKGLCSTSPTAVPISKERVLHSPAISLRHLPVKTSDPHFPKRAPNSVHKWAKNSICSELVFQSVTDDGKCAWGLQLGKRVFVHSASIITTSVISRAGCVSINSMTFSSLPFSCDVLAASIKQRRLRKANSLCW